jgi:trimethylamine--corrinoid protein Co-methyltransferase
VNTGLHRPATKKDVGDIARLIDAAAEIDLNCVVVAAQDVPPATQMVHGFAATIANTMKGVTACPDSRFAMERIVEIAMLVAGGEAELRERPLLDANVGLVSPLRLSREATDVLELAARNGIPSDPCSMAMAGGTAPVTIAGTLVVQNAELLAALVFTQLVERGVGFIYSTAGGHLDLRHATSTFGSPESALVAAGMTSLAEHYALPVFTNGLFGDAKLSDAQLGHEKTLCALSAALLGSHEIGGAGMVDLGMTFDFGQLLIDNEIAGMIRRFAAGIPVSDETLMIDEIHAAARSGDFLSRESTLRRTRDGSAPRLFERRVRDAWLADGGRELQERAIDEARLLLEEHVVAPLDTEVREEIERILTRADDGTGL